MPESNPLTAPAGLQPWLDLCSKTIEQNLDLARIWMDAGKQAGDLHAVRTRLLNALRESLDTFMRQPAFLEAMRHNFLVMSEYKSRGEDMAQEFARETGMPRLPDISGLFERLNAVQKSIRTRLVQVERRLSELEAKARQSEQGAAADNSA